MIGTLNYYHLTKTTAGGVCIEKMNSCVEVIELETILKGKRLEQIILPYWQKNKCLLLPREAVLNDEFCNIKQRSRSSQLHFFVAVVVAPCCVN